MEGANIMPAATLGAAERRLVLVLFGSETGNSEDVAEDLARRLQRLRLVPVVDEMNGVQIVGC
jgi:sulfite reductase alpha subunit-like flavoprotein